MICINALKLNLILIRNPVGLLRKKEGKESYMEKICCICKKTFIGFGNNPEPIMSGCCCEYCNGKFVVPVGLYNTTKEKINNYEIVRNHKEFVLTKEKLKEKNFEKIETMPFFRVYKNPESEETVAMLLV